MKKALIIANMLFASATVFGMDKQSVQIEESSAISQSQNLTQISFSKEKYQSLLEISQEGLKNNKWLSEDAKLLYSKLKFEDVCNQIELVFRSSLNRSDTEDFFDRILDNVRASKEYVDIAEKVTNNAKIFYRKVLGDSELGGALYKKVVETIDAGNYIQCSDLASMKNSFSRPEERITVRYCTTDDFLLTLIHETGHVLERFYRDMNRLPESTQQQGEYVSTFFETLLEGKNFRGNLYSQDYSLHGLRIGEVYLDLLKKSFIDELIASCDKEILFKFYSDEYLKSKISEKKENIELDRILEDLELNPGTKLFMDAFHDLYNIGMSITPNYDSEDNQEKEIEWRNCLKMLENIQGYDDLKQILREANLGKGSYFNLMRTIKGSSEYYGMLRVGEQSEERIDFPPELEKMNWFRIFDFASEKVGDFKSSFEEVIIVANCAAKSSENTNSWKLWKFLNNSTKLKFLKVFGIIASSVEMLNKEVGLKLQTYVLEKSVDYVSSMLNISNLDNHTEGKYNAFRLIKEKGYLDILKDGKSLPIEEIMEELTKPVQPLNLTEKSVEEFFEFLKTGKLAS